MDLRICCRLRPVDGRATKPPASGYPLPARASTVAHHRRTQHQWDHDGAAANWTNLHSAARHIRYPIYDWVESDLWPITADQMPTTPVRPHCSCRLTLPNAHLPAYGDDQRRDCGCSTSSSRNVGGYGAGQRKPTPRAALTLRRSGKFRKLKKKQNRGHTWESFANLLLRAFRPKQRTLKNKIAVSVWCNSALSTRYSDEADPKRRPPKRPVVAAHLQGATAQRLLVQGVVFKPT